MKLSDSKTAVLDQETLSLLEESLAILETSFDKLPAFQSQTDSAAIKTVLNEVAERMKDNFPYPHPLYVGQMLKPPHAVARLAYMLSLFINPNNHALDGGRASSAMEKSAVANIALMLGYKEHLGHLTSGGTMANLEALWIADQIHPGKLVVASSQAHYTHSRLTEVLKIPFQSIEVDSKARMDIKVLESLLSSKSVGTVVVTTGTTATGSVDPLVQILELQKKYKFRIHIDAAYGGYFKLVKELKFDTRSVFDLLGAADSIVIDPHKHGLQPYGCGCVLFKDPSVGKFYKHDSPYTYFSSDQMHLGEISLECSRPGSSAVALWATQKLLPMSENGDFACDLTKSHKAAIEFYNLLKNDDRFIVPFEPELDIVVYALKANSASEASQKAKEAFNKTAEAGLHLALANLPKSFFESKLTEMNWDQENITSLRSCLMKPEHLDWLPEIWKIIDQSV